MRIGFEVLYIESVPLRLLLKLRCVAMVAIEAFIEIVICNKGCH